MKYTGIRRGLTAKHALLPWEHEEDLDAIIQAFEKRFKPVDDYERLEIKQCAECFWRLERATRNEANIFEIAALNEIVKSKEEYANLHKGNLEAIALLKASFEFEKFRRYEAHLRKAYKEALARVERLASLRTTSNEAQLPEPVTVLDERNPNLKSARIDLPISKKIPFQVAGSRLREDTTQLAAAANES